MEHDHFSNLGKGPQEEHFCEITLKSATGRRGDVF